MSLNWAQKGNLKGNNGETGDTVPKGETGLGWRSATIALTGSATVQLTNITPSAGIQVGDKLLDINGDVYEVATVGDGSVTIGASKLLTVKGAKGDKGDPGEKGEDGTGVSIKGSVANSEALPGTGEAGDAYVVQDTGNLWIWDEETQAFVDTGAQIKGPKGDKGDTGDPGEAATVTVGTVSTGEPGTMATVTNAGDETNATLNFVIPRGNQGPVGPGVQVGSGAPSEPGTVGECYIDVTTGDLYRYEETN